MDAAALKSIIRELGHQEITQKPRYLRVPGSSNPFLAVEELINFYKERAPTAHKVIKALKTGELSDSQRNFSLTQIQRIYQQKKKISDFF